MIKIGKNILHHYKNKEKGFSQKSFAYEVGLNRIYIGVEPEEKYCRLKLIRIAKALKLVGELFPAIKFLKIN